MAKKLEFQKDARCPFCYTRGILDLVAIRATVSGKGGSPIWKCRHCGTVSSPRDLSYDRKSFRTMKVCGDRNVQVDACAYDSLRRKDPQVRGNLYPELAKMQAKKLHNKVVHG